MRQLCPGQQQTHDACAMAAVRLEQLKHPLVRAAVLIVTTAYAGGVGFSRVAGAVHWPSDVLGGLLLAVGVLSAAMAVWPGRAEAGQQRSDHISP